MVHPMRSKLLCVAAAVITLAGCSNGYDCRTKSAHDKVLGILRDNFFNVIAKTNQPTLTGIAALAAVTGLVAEVSELTKEGSPPSFRVNSMPSRNPPSCPSTRSRKKAAIKSGGHMLVVQMSTSRRRSPANSAIRFSESMPTEKCRRTSMSTSRCSLTLAARMILWFEQNGDGRRIQAVFTACSACGEYVDEDAGLP